MRMIDHADDEDEFVDESTSVAAAMPAQGEAIRKRRQRGKSSLTRADLPRNPCLLVKTPSSDCFCLLPGNDAALVEVGLVLRPFEELFA
ncbi:hypothetical protein PR003_g28766 [Phytophthora rubi]|uniref:Uncharacterized protein n=1 Tax=Phytophthora rubi TaxID=129364 RepID=A0A6A3H9N7_9STRA|nr:hypothetical protein PR002_g28539 [Phytophthora rubi]KAE9277532.1 hypothetical protein PR003_g28766 [Phytophthora rubi]